MKRLIVLLLIVFCLGACKPAPSVMVEIVGEKPASCMDYGSVEICDVVSHSGVRCVLSVVMTGNGSGTSISCDWSPQ